MKLEQSYGDLPEAFSWKGSVAGKTWVGGKITYIGDAFLRDDDFKDNVTQEVFPIVLDDEVTVWITSKKDIERNPRPDRKYQAIAKAVIDAGAEELLEGADLMLKHDKDGAVKKGNAEKLYAAKYTPPAKGMAMAATVSDDEEAPF